MFETTRFIPYGYVVRTFSRDILLVLLLQEEESDMIVWTAEHEVVLAWKALSAPE